MKKWVLCLGVCSLLFPTLATATPGGITVGGYCQSTGPIAGAMQLNSMQAAIGIAINKSEASIVRAIADQTMALQGVVAASNSDKAKQEAKHRAIDQKAQVEKEKYDAHASVAIEDICRSRNVAGYSLNRNAALTKESNRVLAEEDRNLGMGVKIDTYDKDKIRGEAAKFVEQHGTIFPDYPLYTKEQWEAWSDLSRIFMPFWKNPRPKFTNEQQEARYLTAETRARDARVIVSEPLREFGLNRQATEKLDGIMSWAGDNISKPYFTIPKIDKDGMVDPDGTERKEAKLVSKDVILQLIGERYTSEDFINKLDASNETVVVKEQMRLQGFTYKVLLDIRNSLIIGNVMKSIELADMIEKFQNETDTLTTGVK